MEGTGLMTDRSAIGGDRNVPLYDQSKGSIFALATNAKNVVVMFDDGSGTPRTLSSLDERTTGEWLSQHAKQPAGASFGG
jgi:hypothetical protein